MYGEMNIPTGGGKIGVLFIVGGILTVVLNTILAVKAGLVPPVRRPSQPSTVNEGTTTQDLIQDVQF